MSLVLTPPLFSEDAIDSVPYSSACPVTVISGGLSDTVPGAFSFLQDPEPSAIAPVLVNTANCPADRAGERTRPRR